MNEKSKSTHTKHKENTSTPPTPNNNFLPKDLSSRIQCVRRRVLYKSKSVIENHTIIVTSHHIRQNGMKMTTQLVQGKARFHKKSTTTKPKSKTHETPNTHSTHR